MPNLKNDREKWLLDEVVDLFTEGLLVRSKENDDLPRIHVYSYRFREAWHQENFDNRIMPMCELKVDLFNLDLVLFQQSINKHWVLFIVSPKTKRIVRYDSFLLDIGSERQ